MFLDQGLRSTFNNDWNFQLPLTDLIPCPCTLLKQAVPVAAFAPQAIVFSSKKIYTLKLWAIRSGSDGAVTTLSVRRETHTSGDDQEMESEHNVCLCAFLDLL
jgi:hypothetical protein